ncbi:MAG TPA: MaoC family dehydratase N-terminal domain-containing protein [Acidimicrobiales bacterium]|jgi:hypothetical protein|nr:MaoC family dehydratase N-terminal domain-containing protein [Acidimicrobiales bacterium]
MYPWSAEPGKVREFALAVKAQPSAHEGAEAVIPPTFLTTARLVWEPREQDVMRELHFDMARVLHGEEEYTFFGPPPKVGETLDVETRVEKQFEKPGGRGGTMRFAVVVNEFRDAAGAVVAQQRTTVIETEGA